LNKDKEFKDVEFRVN